MIRPAEQRDLKEILTVYQAARAYMKQNGNPTQWGDTYPATELLQADIAAGDLYLCIRDGQICGVFALIFGDDPAYAVIDGAWPHDDLPYAAIHRVASDGTAKGVFAECIDYCKTRSDTLRIDTHEDNKTMRYLIEKHGFQHCGTVHMPEDGSPRIAYQYTMIW